MTTVLVAHGSPDPRHARTLNRLRDRVRARVGPTELAFLEHDDPSPACLAARLHGAVTVVPLLITPDFHARVDVPGAARSIGEGGATVRLAPPLGGEQLLLTAVAERVRAAGHAVDVPVLLVAGGSSSGRVGDGLRALLDRHPVPGWAVTTLAAPDHEAARDRVVVPFTLAEGVLHDRVADLAAGVGAPFVPGGLGETEAVPTLIASRAAS